MIHKPGDEVHVPVGAFRDMAATVIEVTDLVVRLDVRVFGKSVAIDVPASAFGDGDQQPPRT